MNQKISFEGWDDLSSQEQETIQLWIQGTLDADQARQQLDIHKFSVSDDRSSGIPLNSIAPSSIESRRIKLLEMLDNCIIRCRGRDATSRQQCMKECKEEN